MFKAGKMIAFAVLAAGVLAGCGTTQPAAAPGPIAAQGPEWVNRGGAAFKDSAMYGVGIASGIRNRALAVDAADARARAKIAETLQVKLTKLIKDYQNSTTAGDMSKSSEEQMVNSAAKSFTETTLSGVEIVDHWKDPSDGTMYSLAKLDPAAVKARLDSAKELDAKMRDFVRANADKAFDELKAESAANAGK